MTALARELWNAGRPVGYVSFLSALVHHGVLVDGLARVQVASADRAGQHDAGPVLIEYCLLPKDLWFGYRVEAFEGEQVPVATPEKALLDWCWLAEQEGLDPRLGEMEWETLDVALLDLLAAETGIAYRRLLPPAGRSAHDQDRLRAEMVARLRSRAPTSRAGTAWATVLSIPRARDT